MHVRIHPQNSLQSFTTSQSNVETVTSVSSRESKRNVSEPSAPRLPDHCIFCKKAKYKPKSKTREKTQSCVEFRADKTVRDSALLHIEQCTDMCYVAQEVLGICSKDLISSEAIMLHATKVLLGFLIYMFLTREITLFKERVQEL